VHQGDRRPSPFVVVGEPGRGDAGTTTRAIYSLFGSKDGLLVALIFRRFALEHPALFSIAFHHADPAIWPRFRTAAMDALAVLDKRFEPLADADLLGGRSLAEASTQFRALGEGVAWTELRGNPLPPDPKRFWRNAFHALITGFAAPTPHWGELHSQRSHRA
jgi:AcrR family transcriptional regulator